MGGEGETVRAPYETRLRLRNSRSVDLELHLEPWGEQYDVAPGVVVDLVFTADAAGVAEIDESGARMTVYGWTGSTVTILREGQELTGGAGRIE